MPPYLFSFQFMFYFIKKKRKRKKVQRFSAPAIDRHLFFGATDEFPQVCSPGGSGKVILAHNTKVYLLERMTKPATFSGGRHSYFENCVFHSGYENNHAPLLMKVDNTGFTKNFRT